MDELELSPSIRRRHLGRVLREKREAVNMTMTEAAKVSRLSRASISRIESAKQVILPRTVKLLCQTYGVGAPEIDHLLRLAGESEDRGWLVTYAGTTPDWFSRYVAEESDASVIETFELVFIPGLLQTAAYCLAVTEANRAFADTSDFAQVVEFRLARQQRLDDDELRYHAVVSEAALRQLVGGPGVMRAQLDHLRYVAGRPNVTFQVLPFTAGAHPAMVSAFTLLHFPGDVTPPTIFIEVEDGGLYPEGPSDVARYQWVWAELCHKALSPHESIQMVATMIDELTPPAAEQPST